MSDLDVASRAVQQRAWLATAASVVATAVVVHASPVFAALSLEPATQPAPRPFTRPAGTGALLPAPHAPAQHAPAQHEPAQHEPAQHEPAQHAGVPAVDWTHASLHPQSSIVYFEFPDLQAAAAAYANAPLVRTATDEELRAAVGDLLPPGVELEFELADAEAAFLAQVPQWPFAQTPLQLARNLEAASISVRTPTADELGAGRAPAVLAERLGVQCVLEFADATAASDFATGFASGIARAADAAADSQETGAETGAEAAVGADDARTHPATTASSQPIALPLPPEAALLGLSAWIVADGARVVIAFGNADFSHAAYVARRDAPATPDTPDESDESGASIAAEHHATDATLHALIAAATDGGSTDGTSTAAMSAGTLIVRGWQRASVPQLAIEALPLLASTEPDDVQLQEAVAAMLEQRPLLRRYVPEALAFLTSPPGAGAYRTTLSDEGFVTDWFLAPAEAGSDTASAAPRRIDADQLDRVPADATGAWICGIDGERLVAVFRDAIAAAPFLEGPLGELERGAGVDIEQDLLAPLGTPVVYMGELPGLAPPAILAEFPVRDPEAYDRALAKLLPALAALRPQDLGARSRPYRRQPYHELNLVGPMFAEWPVRPEFAFGIAGGRLLVGLPTGRGAVIVKQRLRDMAESASATAAPAGGASEQPAAAAAAANAARHRLLASLSASDDLVAVSFVDWPSIVRDVYGALRALGGLASGMGGGMGGGGMGGLPFDLGKLPEPELLVRHLVPHVTVRRASASAPALAPESNADAGTHGIVHVRSTSNIGPELYLAALAIPLAAGITESVPVGGDADDWDDAGAAGEIEFEWQEDPSGSGDDDPGASGEHATTRAALQRVRSAIRVWSIFADDQLPADLETLTRPTEALPEGAFQGQPVPRDGWGRELVYRLDGDSYRLWSRGPDGIDDGGGGDDVEL